MPEKSSPSKKASSKKSARKRVIKKPQNKKAGPREENEQVEDPVADTAAETNSAALPAQSDLIPVVMEDELPVSSPADSQESEAEEKNSSRKRGSRQNNSRGSRRESKTPVDLEEVAQKAWEIYQAELEEEGVALINPNRGREISRQCLQLARIFCEERNRFCAVNQPNKEANMQGQ